MRNMFVDINDNRKKMEKKAERDETQFMKNIIDGRTVIMNGM